MNSAYLPAPSALAGSAISASAAFATTWLTQHHRDRTQRATQESTRREELCGEFIDQAAVPFADALTRTIESSSTMGPLFVLCAELWLFASHDTIDYVDDVLDQIVRTDHQPNENPRDGNLKRERFDALRRFAEAYRNGLDV